MKPCRLDSTALAGIEYEETTQRLYVQFRDGANYAYVAVPVKTYEALLLASSPGGYFNTDIRGQYAYERLD